MNQTQQKQDPLFVLPSDVQQLKGGAEIETVLRPISAQSVLRRDSFSNGPINFRFAATAVDKYFFPTRSFFNIRTRLTRADGTPLLKADGVALAQNCAANLFKSCTVRLGGQTITTTTSYLPEIDTLRYRLGKSNDWINGVGDQFNMWGTWEERLNRTALDGDGNTIADGPKVDLTDITVTNDQGVLPHIHSFPKNNPDAPVQWLLEVVRKDPNNSGYGDATSVDFFSRDRIRLRLACGGNIDHSSSSTDARRVPDLTKVIKRFDWIELAEKKFHVDRIVIGNENIDHPPGQQDQPAYGHTLGEEETLQYPALRGTTLGDVYVYFVESDPASLALARQIQVDHGQTIQFPGGLENQAPLLVPGMIAWQATYVNPGVSEIDLLWSPPSSLFHQHRKPLPQAAELEIELTVEPNYRQDAIEARSSTLNDSTRRTGPQPSSNFNSGDGQYQFSVEKMIFNLCESKGLIFKQRKFMIDLEEIDAQIHSIPGNDAAESPFTVNRSTNAITVAFSDKRSHSTESRISKSVFKVFGSTDEMSNGVRDAQEMKLRSLSIGYAGQNYPLNQPEFKLDTEYSGTTSVIQLPTNNLQQRYYENLMFSGRLNSPIQVESFSEWLRRGLYFHWNCKKPAGNRATRVIVRHQFADSTDTTQMNCLVFCHYRKVTDVTLNAVGRIDSINQWSIM